MRKKLFVEKRLSAPIDSLYEFFSFALAEYFFVLAESLLMPAMQARHGSVHS